LLATIEFDEEAIGCGDQVFVCRKIVRSQGCTTEKGRQNFRPIRFRKRLELGEKSLRSLGHEFSVAPWFVRVKSAAART
jgi:hypothetical protein